MTNPDKGLILFYDWKSCFELLSGDECKKLILAMIDFSRDGKEPPDLEGMAQMAVNFIFPQIKRAKDAHEQKSRAGKAGGEKRVQNAKEREKNQADSSTTQADSSTTQADSTYNTIQIQYNNEYNNKYNTNVCSLPSVENCAADAPRLTEEQPKKREKSPKEDERAEDVKRIVDHLNERCGVRYRPSTKDTRGHILARLREGYTVEDFEAVIDKMANAWIGSDMERYLRPSTLFGSKFEGYLNGNFTPRTSSKAPKDELWQYISENIG